MDRRRRGRSTLQNGEGRDRSNSNGSAPRTQADDLRVSFELECILFQVDPAYYDGHVTCENGSSSPVGKKRSTPTYNNGSRNSIPYRDPVQLPCRVKSRFYF